VDRLLRGSSDLLILFLLIRCSETFGDVFSDFLLTSEHQWSSALFCDGFASGRPPFAQFVAVLVLRVNLPFVLPLSPPPSPAVSLNGLHQPQKEAVALFRSLFLPSTVSMDLFHLVGI